MEFSLTLASREDDPFLEELFNDVRAPEFAPLGLPASTLAQLLAMQLLAQRTGYASQFPNAEDRIIWIAGERAGRLLVDRTQSEIRLVDVALLACYRGHGVGGRLLSDLRDEARVKRLPLRLTVRFGNPARLLYERHGFVRAGGDGINIDMELSPQAKAAPPATGSALLEEQGPLKQGTTGQYYLALVGQTLVARSPDGVTADLILESVIALDGHKRRPGTPIGNSFVLTFRGPLSPVLPSVTVEMTPPSAAPKEVFIVPLGPQDGAMLYESVFYRL